MKTKKLLATAVAGALVAAQMVMPVMADGGSLTVPVQTKTPIIRVVVPTSMEIAVNQFEMGDEGSQIYSSDFEMRNKSEIPVKVSVTSTATLGASTTLLGSKAAVGSSTKSGDAWLAAAAQTASGVYGTLAELDESSDNVTAFAAGTETSTAKQVYYLKETSGMAYKLLNKAEDASGIEYAQFYKLTEIQSASQETVDEEIAKGDVYHAATAGLVDQATLEKIPKGGSTTFSGSNTYFTIASGPTAKESIDPAEYYVYGNGTADVAAGVAGFRYIGKLSSAQESWTNTDLTQIKVDYEIAGVESSKYTEVAEDCTYGFYTAQADEVTGTKITNAGGSTAYSTPAALADRLKSGAVVFQLGSSDMTKISGLTVSKIVVDGQTYQFTSANNSSTVATSDGKTYTLTGFSASTATEVEVYYGDTVVVKYTLS